MTTKLEKQLQQKYPELFKNLDGEPNLTALAFGLECEDGWYDLIDELCKDIQTYVVSENKKQPIITQLKEKFGGLRFYCSNKDDYILKRIKEAEEKSLTICEICGSPEGVLDRKGWWKVKCINCKHNI